MKRRQMQLKTLKIIEFHWLFCELKTAPLLKNPINQRLCIRRLYFQSMAVPPPPNLFYFIYLFYVIFMIIINICYIYMIFF